MTKRKEDNRTKGQMNQREEWKKGHKNERTKGKKDQIQRDKRKKDNIS